MQTYDSKSPFNSRLESLVQQNAPSDGNFGEISNTDSTLNSVAIGENTGRTEFADKITSIQFMLRTPDEAPNSSMNRRRFMRTVLAGALAVVANSSVLAQNRPKKTPSSPKGVSPHQDLPPIIDTHIHLVRGNPYLKELTGYGKKMTDTSPQEKARYLENNMSSAGVRMAFAMGHLDGGADDPLGIKSSLRIAEYVPRLRVLGVADPRLSSREDLLRVERQIDDCRDKIVGLKAYPGYQHFGLTDPGFEPFYRLAAKYKLPVVFHSGDAMSTTARLKFCHPLLVDEVAVKFPAVHFVIAHFGVPFHTEAAEVVFKNDNVHADLSGLYVGDAQSVQKLLAARALPRSVLGLNIAHLKDSLEYCGYDRIMYGSDWPAMPMAPYRQLLEAIIPASQHNRVLRTNAEKLFVVSCNADREKRL